MLTAESLANNNKTTRKVEILQRCRVKDPTNLMAGAISAKPSDQFTLLFRDARYLVNMKLATYELTTKKPAKSPAAAAA